MFFISGCSGVAGDGLGVDLSVGDCFNPPGGAGANSALVDIEKIDCSSPHYAEVFRVIDLGDYSSYPGDEVISEMASSECLGDNFSDFIGVEFEESDVHASSFVPNRSTWSRDGNEIICFAFIPDENFSGTMKDLER